MSKVACLSEGQIEGLAKMLGECGSGSDITRVLGTRGLTDNSDQSTKWRRLYWVFLDLQSRDKCANRVLDFIQTFLTPARFVGRKEVFEQHRNELNVLLAFSGLEFGADGRFRQREAARTLDEAERRLQTIRIKFQNRRLHPEVLKYCKTELMQDNYFHAVFETKDSYAVTVSVSDGNGGVDSIDVTINVTADRAARGGALQRDRRSELDERHELVEQRGPLGMAQSRNGRGRPRHGSASRRE